MYLCTYMTYFMLDSRSPSATGRTALSAATRYNESRLAPHTYGIPV